MWPFIKTEYLGFHFKIKKSPTGHHLGNKALKKFSLFPPNASPFLYSSSPCCISVILQPQTNYPHIAGRGTPSRAQNWALSSTLKWIVRGDTCVDKARDFIGARVESRRVRETRRTALPHSLGFYSYGISFQLVFSQLFWLKRPSWWCTPYSAKMDASEKDSGRWSDMWCLLLTCPELSQLVMAY